MNTQAREVMNLGEGLAALARHPLARGADA